MQIFDSITRRAQGDILVSQTKMLELPFQSSGSKGIVPELASKTLAKMMVHGLGNIPDLRDLAPDPSYEVLPRSVIGPTDDRIRVNDPVSSPWCRICDLVIEGGDQRTYEGTGWLAGPHTIITAAHCIYHETMGGWARSVTAIPGRSPGQTPFDFQRSESFSITPDWLEQNSVSYDFAAIHLPRSFSRDPGFFGFRSATVPELRDQLINISGYPQDKGGDSLWTCRNRISDFEDNCLLYENDTFRGQSGSPVFHFPNGIDQEPSVVAIHTNGVDASNTQNRGVRINDRVASYLQHWLSQSSLSPLT